MTVATPAVNDGAGMMRGGRAALVLWKHLSWPRLRNQKKITAISRLRAAEIVLEEKPLVS